MIHFYCTPYFPFFAIKPLVNTFFPFKLLHLHDFNFIALQHSFVKEKITLSQLRKKVILDAFKGASFLKQMSQLKSRFSENVIFQP